MPGYSPLLPALLALAPAAAAIADERMPPVTHAATRAECGVCHMAYQPGFLPARSWQAIMGDLANHFGENAQLDEATRAGIESYLVANAASRVRNLAAAQTPLRISELPWFRREHDEEVSPGMLERATSIANCAACHRGAEQGSYEDD